MAILRLAGRWTAIGLFLLAPFAFSSSALAQYSDQPDPRRMIVPAPVEVPSGKSLDDVKDAIYKSINGRGWTGKELAPNLIEATYDQKGNGKRILIVDLKYDTNKVEMTYKDSKSLRYSVVNGEALLHRRASGWMRYLASDIRKFMDQ